MDDDLWDYERREVPEHLIENWLDFPLTPIEILPPHKDEPIVEETEENEQKWDWFQDINDRLRGSDHHSRYMCLLQAYLYDGNPKPRVVEIWNHDLVDKEEKIMGEVGHNGNFNNNVDGFVKRVFRFIKHHAWDVDDIQEWEFWYLNYDENLYKVTPTEEAYEKLMSTDDEIDLRKYDEE